MKAIILAAGKGKRLGGTSPKPLQEITNKKTILDFQISSLGKRIGLENILIVVGYKKELFMKRYPNLNFVYNPQFQNTNTAKSLLLALKKIDSDVICLLGDVYFDEEILDLMIDAKHSCCVVDKKQCDGEEMKYDLGKEGFIRHLSKSIRIPKGEIFGLYLFRKKDLKKIRAELETLDNKDYSPKALENLILRNKLLLFPIYVENFFCLDIDFKRDLEYVRKHLSTNN